MNDYAEAWLRLKKLLATYDAAANLNQWSACEDAAAEMRTLATDLYLWAKTRPERGA